MPKAENRRDYGRGFDHGYWTAVLGIAAYVCAGNLIRRLRKGKHGRQAQ